MNSQLYVTDSFRQLLDSIKGFAINFIKSADEDAASRFQENGSQQNGADSRTDLLNQKTPKQLQHLLNVALPEHGQGKDGVVAATEDVLRYSVNTWHQGFLDKLYSSVTPVGLASELLLTTLNTNVHTYQVSPVLTLIEKQTCRALAEMFGLTDPYAGGLSQTGGSAANQSSMVIARNNLFPETKTDGYGGKKFVLFTSAHGHYSVEKAAQMFGFGSKAVKAVAIDKQGRMIPEALDAAIVKAKEAGETPFYVNATAGTTVLGSFDPLDEIADICQKHNLWFHVDGSWGTSIVFSEKQRHKLKGIHRADSITMCPHKMLNVPITCSLLLGKDLRQFHKAMTLPAGYLFHSDFEEEQTRDMKNSLTNADNFYDLGDLTPQCGRRGDALKLAFSWIYYGTAGFGAHIDHAFEMASYLASLVASNAKFSLLSESPPPCLQVCFYYDKQPGDGSSSRNGQITKEVTKALVPCSFMIDHAPGEDGQFFRVVVNAQTRKETLEALVRAIADVGESLQL